jgi:hypothetical protein
MDDHWLADRPHVGFKETTGQDPTIQLATDLKPFYLTNPQNAKRFVAPHHNLRDPRKPHQLI